MGGFSKEIRSYPVVGNYTWAGTFDLELLCKGGKTGLWDIKTGKPVDTTKYPNGYYNWKPQTAAYRSVRCTDLNGIIHVSILDEQFSVFDLSETYDQDLAFFSALKDAWYKHPEKISELKSGFVPSVTEVLGLLGFPPASWTAVNAMKEKAFELAYIYFEKTESPMEPDRFNSIIEEARKWGGSGMSRAAMAVGKRIHEVIEQWIRQGIEPSNSEPDRIVRAYLNFREWFDEHVEKVLGVEITIYG